MLSMVEKGIRGGICHTIHGYVKAHNKYMKNYYKNKESLYLKYWDVNNLCEWIMSQKLPADGFERVEEMCSDAGYFLEADVQYADKFYELHNDLPFSFLKE